MAVFTTLVPFHHPLASVSVPASRGRMYTEAELEERCRQAHQAGVDSVRVAADQHMVDFRADVQVLCERTLRSVAAVEPALTEQVRDALPTLALEVAKRLLAGYEPPPEVLDRLWREALDELYPEREDLELALCPRDAGLLQEVDPEWCRRYPKLRITADSSLAPGDALVRSRFGLIDSRRQTRLQALQHSLTGT